MKSRIWPVINLTPKCLNCKLDARHIAMTSKCRIEIQYHCLPAAAAVNSMTSKLVMLASWQTLFMTSILVTSSQCVNEDPLRASMQY